jgi:DNA repair protein RadC
MMNKNLELINELVAAEPVKVTEPNQILPFVEEWREAAQEHFIVITLDGAHHVIKTRVVSVGLINRALVHPREVFRDAIIDNAAAIIMCHNHPSGNLEPSDEDIQITTRLKQASKIIGIEILDHIIISSYGHYSFLEAGKI